MRSLRSRPTAWIARSGRARAVLALAVVALGAGAAIAVAGVPGSDGVIHACVQTDPASGKPSTSGANVRVIDPSAGQSCNAAGVPAPEATLAWNTAGPAGPAGPQGPAGANATATLESPSAARGGPVGTLALTQNEKVTAKGDLLSVATVSTGPGSNAAGQAHSKSPSTEIRITKLIDASSPKLMQATVKGTTFDIATVVIYQPGTTTAGTTFKLKGAQIASDAAAVSNGDKPSETLTLVAKQWQVTSSGGGGGLPAVQKIVGLHNPKT